MILGITGHRPDPKLGGWKTPNPIYNYCYNEIKNKFIQLNPTKVISGFALGADQMAAEAAIELGIPLLAAIPHIGQEKIWPKQSQDKYHSLLKKATEVHVVSPGGYAAYKMQVRNEWIVNNSDLMLAVWDGVEIGGTYNCYTYAISKGKTVITINPKHCNIKV